MDDFESVIEQLKKELGEDKITTTNRIPRPQQALDREMFEDFNERNPMAGGGMLVQPSADGSRPGYQGKKPFEKVTIDGKVYKKNPDTGLISFRTTDKNREYKMLRLTPEEVKKRITAPGKAGYASDVPEYERTTIFKKRKEAEKKGLIYDTKTKTFKKPSPTKQEGEQAINKINSWTKKWINTNSKNYGVRDFDKFKKDLTKAWKKQLKIFEKDPKFRIFSQTTLSTEEGLPFVKNLNVNGVSTPIKKNPTTAYEKIFYDQMFKNKDFKKKVIEYLDFVNIDKRFGSVRDDLVAQGKIATDADGKAFFKKSSGSKKAYLDYAKFIDEDVVYFFGDVLNSRRLYNNTPGSLNIYSIIEKNTPPEKIQKYRKKLATAYSSWMNNLKEVADLAGMDFNKVLEMQYNEAAKMKKLFNVSELPFDFQYAQDHLFGLAEAKELGDPKIAKQTLKNLVATTKAQNAYLGTKGFTQKRTKLIRNFKNASLENKANIVNQLNTLAEEYVPGRLQYNVKKDGSLKIANLRPETTFRERAISYRNLAKNFPVAVKKQFSILGGGKCKTRGLLNQGGRVGLQDGTPSVDVCFTNALERIRKGGVDFTKAEAMNFDKLTKGLRAVGASNIMKFGILPEVLFEGALIADKMASEGDSFMQGLRNSYVSIPFQAMGLAKTYEEGRRDEVLAAAPESQRGKVLDVMNLQNILKKKNELAAQSQNLKNQIEDTDRISDGAFGYVGDSQDLQKRLSETRADLQDLYRGDASRAERMLTSSPLDLKIKDQLTMDAYKNAVEKANVDRASNILFAPGAGLGIDTQIKKRMKNLPVTPEYAKEQLQATGDYYGKGYTPFGLNKLFTLFGRQNPKFGFDETGKYSEEKGLNDYMNYLRTLNFAENFRDEKAGGGIAGLSGGIDKGAQRRSMNPDSQGLKGLFNRAMKIEE